MKKFLAILLLCILLFNWVGYRVFTAFLETESSADLVEAFDNQRTENLEMISIKIPSSLPYYSGSGEFEKTVGEIEIDHVQYSYVQCRITHDTIEYICIANKARTAIRKASDQYYKLVNDFQHSGKKESSAKLKMLKSDYCPPENIVFATFYKPYTPAQYEGPGEKYYSLSVAPPDLPPGIRI